MPDAPYAAEFAKLKAENPCGDARRWEEAKRDAAAFLAKWGAEAERLGWPASDLFGLNPFAPLARYSDMGLVWIMQGREVRELTPTYARFGNTRYYRQEADGTPRWAISDG